MDRPTITNETIVDYSLCPRKAFLCLFGQDQGTPNEYVQILERLKFSSRTESFALLKEQNTVVKLYTSGDLEKDYELLVEANLRSENLEAYCDILKKTSVVSPANRYEYRPIMISGTYTVTKEQRIELSFIGYVLDQIQGKPPRSGNIIDAEGNSHSLKLDNQRVIKPIIQAVNQWVVTPPVQPPPVILNKHCPYCQFYSSCKDIAEKNDDLSLLERLTPKLVRRYQEKGILTIKQLSYLFKPRRRGKRKKRGIVLYKPELQALALRTGKIYIQQMPEIQRRDVELFLDVEGIPDRKFYYLIGLLVCDGDNNSHYSFWAESSPDEKHIWQQFLDKVSEYPEAPIYHYGSFEPRAIRLMANRYQSQQGELKKRLVNLNSYIYGHLYFPTRSNRLKEIGDFIGAKWTAQDASGLQSLVWRHLWEETKKEEFKQTIILYNREDCQAIKLLADEICKIKSTADRQPNIDYADTPKKYSTEIGAEIHSQFQTILRFAHANYDSKKISFGETSPVEKNKRGLRKGHPGYHRAIPETAEVQHWPLREICPRCGDQNLIPAERVAQLIITDLVFTQNGLSKKTLRLEGNYGYCPKCYRHYGPESLHGYSAFGHGFQSWVIYQRFSLRLPYESIVQSLDEQFSESISPGGITEIIRRFGKFYKDTEKISLERMLASPFIHVDETKVNVQGIDHYVWVFTDGKRVILRVTETREATIVHEILEGFKGILVSDFYGGYDALPCLQQKCLVHLIRDLNDDLWKSPFDEEYQDFVLAVKKLIVPIMETVHNYGLKKEYLSVFQVKVEFFYKEVINGSTFSSELAQKYQKRFIRHKQNLFTFLDYDGIPWNNNTAERALRPLVVQENISKTFFKSIFQQHLLLLGIMQTCRFQQKSFLKFLISGQKDVDHFGLGNI